MRDLEEAFTKVDPLLKKSSKPKRFKCLFFSVAPFLFQNLQLTEIHTKMTMDFHFLGIDMGKLRSRHIFTIEGRAS